MVAKTTRNIRIRVIKSPDPFFEFFKSFFILAEKRVAGFTSDSLLKFKFCKNLSPRSDQAGLVNLQVQ
jgi:hypothetical protein